MNGAAKPSGEDRLRAAFAACRARDEAALVAYAMAGDPTLERSLDTFVALSEAGADILEIGVPFSDPIADGPVIQRASERALKSGTSLRQVLAWLPEVRRRVRELPLVIMTYANVIENMGVGEFARSAEEVGLAGVVVPDLPFEESGPLHAALSEHRVGLIPLCTPNTSAGRACTIARDAKGFVYCVAVSGVTGERAELPSDLVARLELLRRVCAAPVVAGFGISSAEHGAELARHADGVVVGSALVRAAFEGGPALARRICEAIKRGLRSPLAVSVHS